MEYDNVKKFLVYESWIKNILKKSKRDREQAKEMWFQILLAASGVGMDTDDEDLRDNIEDLIMPNIKAAQTRYENKVSNGSKGGRPKDDIDQALVFELRDGGATYQEIADQLGVHKNTIQNRMNEWHAEYEEHKNTKTTKTKTENTKTKNNNNNNQDKDIDIDNDSDTFTTGKHFDF